MAKKDIPVSKRFRAAKQNRIFQDIVEQIQAAILNGDYQPGSILPSERDLKEMFQTSRGTLREALRVLEQKGLIEIRLGVNGGAVVKGSVAEPLAESLGLLLRYRMISLNHLHEFREDVEGIVAGKAAERANKADVENLESLLKKIEEILKARTPRRDKFLAVDKEFHQMLAQITGNPIYIFIHKIIHDNIQTYYDAFLELDEVRLKENFQDLCDIFESVKNREVNKAWDLAQCHVRKNYRYMRPNQMHPHGALRPPL
jgi:DNA-binding FadR family transcriptional regulator